VKTHANYLGALVKKRAGSNDLRMKRLLVVLDGASDLPSPDLNGKTPLETARAPNLGRLAAISETGCAKIAGNLAPESDVGVFAVLGFDPYEFHVGRGALEAYGAGMRFKNGWLGLRANFATSDASGRKLLDRRVGRNLTTREAKLLEREVSEKVRLDKAKFVFRATVAHRAVLLFKASGLSRKISNTDPAYTMKGGLSSAEEKFEMRVLRCVALAKEAQKSAALVNEFVEKSHWVLQESKINKKRVSKGLLPANVILLRDAETRLKKPPSRFKNWAILADMPLEVGIGKLLEMKILPVATPTFTATDYPPRVKKTLAALKKFECVYVHLKGPDLFGHDGDAVGKTKCIEDIDRVYFGPLLKKLDLKNTRLLVTSDHTTACVKAAHTADSVPFLITSGGKTGGKYDEAHCRRKKAIAASELMPMLLI